MMRGSFICIVEYAVVEQSMNQLQVDLIAVSVITGSFEETMNLEPGSVRLWLDQGPAILLKRVEIDDPVLVDDVDIYDVQTEAGWTIKLMSTGELIDVHEDTLHLNIQDV